MLGPPGADECPVFGPDAVNLGAVANVQACTLLSEPRTLRAKLRQARGVRLRPVPATPPPIWVGGNSKPAVRRAVSHAQGWAPFNTFGYAAASRTAEISTLEDLESAIAWAKRYAAEVGRTAPLDICFSAGNLLDDTRSTDERHATIAKLESMGVTWLTIAPQGADRAEVIDHARAFAEEFIA